MKSILLLLFIIVIISTHIHAQNVGIGTSQPSNKLEVSGSLLVNTPTTATNSTPTAGQIKTMINPGVTFFLSSDSTGRFFDPGGPAGNYTNSQACNVDILAASNCVGIAISIESLDLGTGDSIFIQDGGGNPLMAIGSGYVSTGEINFNSGRLLVFFTSNADGNNGAGFSILFRRLFDNSSSQPNVSGITGKAFYFDVKTGAIRSGGISNVTTGIYSTALGFNSFAIGNYSTSLGVGNTCAGLYSTAIGEISVANGLNSTAIGRNNFALGAYATAIGHSSNAGGSNAVAIGHNAVASGTSCISLGDNNIASGFYSTAMGNNTEASGDNATAIGFNTTASGARSTAMGDGTTASGTFSTAMGKSTVASQSWATAMGMTTTASGFAATAMGRNTTASGDYSTAIGNYVSTSGEEGALIIGDNSTTTVLASAIPNSFRARFDGGYRFFTSAAATTAESCLLAAGTNAWSTTSDVRLKENFEKINGEDFLKKISAMNLTSWNYKKQDASKFRHYGPMAQDFYAAFGKDKYGTIGNDTTINSADFDGVNLIAIQALEKRTSLQKTETEKITSSLKIEIEALKAIILQQQKEIELIKQKQAGSL
ncbi:MAG: hypothetical protein HOP10_12910 [Chitinophagaceae bacterium]|nr:hypothetical protein [Chitinophagaceae bacterium]